MRLMAEAMNTQAVFAWVTLIKRTAKNAAVACRIMESKRNPITNMIKSLFQHVGLGYIRQE